MDHKIVTIASLGRGRHVTVCLKRKNVSMLGAGCGDADVEDPRARRAGAVAVEYGVVSGVVVACLSIRKGGC